MYLYCQFIVLLLYSILKSLNKISKRISELFQEHISSTLELSFSINRTVTKKAKGNNKINQWWRIFFFNFMPEISSTSNLRFKNKSKHCTVINNEYKGKWTFPCTKLIDFIQNPRYHGEKLFMQQCRVVPSVRLTLSSVVHPLKDFITSVNRTRSLPDTSRIPPVDPAMFVSVVATWGTTTDQMGRDSEGTRAASKGGRRESGSGGSADGGEEKGDERRGKRRGEGRGVCINSTSESRDDVRHDFNILNTHHKRKNSTSTRRGCEITQ